MTNQLYVYNSLNNQKELFKPLNDNQVKMYVCGMTTYDYCHLGHARVVVSFDAINRWLRTLGYQVTYVQNITDIDDKIIDRANQNQESIFDLTNRFIQYMNEDFKNLNILQPDVQPKATDHISAMTKMIHKLIKDKHAYVAENGDVYFDIHSAKQYGLLKNISTEPIDNVVQRDINKNYKKNELDFVLWKTSKLNEPSWDSPFGKGRPGWHIECSAMSQEYLGDTFDIHGGGSDLQFPHHENEIAQSYHFHKKSCHEHHNSHVKYWLHNGFVTLNGKKMSKSTNNFITIRDFLKEHSPEALRFLILQSHYRSPLNFSMEKLEQAKQGLITLYFALNHIDKNKPIKFNILNNDNPYVIKFIEAMNDDFNTANAIAVLFELANAVNQNKSNELAHLLKKLANTIGLLENDFLETNDKSSLTDNEINQLIEKRNLARINKDWQLADEIRNQLKEQNIIINDTQEQTSWFRT